MKGCRTRVRMYRSALTCSTCLRRTIASLRRIFRAKYFDVSSSSEDVLRRTSRTFPNVPVPCMPDQFMFADLHMLRITKCSSHVKISELESFCSTGKMYIFIR